MSEVSETLGQRLKAERERKGLSVQKAADELHLDAWVVDALESGDYALIGPSVYTKGHLKRYAGVLGLPVAEVLEAYETRPSASAPPSAAKAAAVRMRTSAPAGSEFQWVQIAGFAVVALGLAGVLWWKPWHPRVAVAPAASAALPAAAASAAPTQEPSSQPDGVVGAGTGGPAGAISAVAALAPAAATSGATAAVRSDTDPMAGVGHARLRLRFSSDSWVDVHDASGQRVFAGNGRANSVKTIAGAAPLRVYLKSASGVQLEINNHAVAIGTKFVAGNVARFEAGADGVLRRDPHAASASGAAIAAARPRG
jgi:cytoskeleton protein RodZ